MRNVYVRFESPRDGLMGPTYGPFEFIQITYDLLRCDDEIIAEQGESGEWYTDDEERYSDFVIFAE